MNQMLDRSPVRPPSFAHPRRSSVGLTGRWLSLATVCLIALSLTACAGPRRAPEAHETASIEAGITQVRVGDRKPAPVIAGKNLDGRPLSSASFAGKTLVVTVWGSWCGPCRKEAPALAKASRTLSTQGVQLLGVNVQDNPSSAKAFEKTYGITYPSLDDRNQRSLLGFADSLPAQGVPTTWIIDADGKVAARIFTSGLTAATLTNLIEDVRQSVA